MGGAPPPRQTVSELVARILEQLSLSAWLPSGILVFAMLLLGSLRAHQADPGLALAALGHLSFASLVLILGAIVLGTVLTQAFQFEAIRMLEGYWGPGPMPEAVANARCRRHLARRNDIWARLELTADRAFREAAAAMLADGVAATTVEAASRVHRKEVALADLPELERATVDAHAWETYAPMRLLRRMDALAAAATRYPKDDRAIRPTRLGNMLRAYEDPVEEDIGRPIEGFVQGIVHRLPAVVLVDHDHLRSRLDLYCSLVLVFLVCGLSGVALLASVDALAAIAAGVAGSALAWLSYGAAVTSARAYGALLNTLVQFEQADDEAPR
jgi:hypothetical protein